MEIDQTHKLTHAVAVTGYVYRKGKFLVLLRNKEPRVWAPPGGQLERDENPRQGLQREIWEETGFRVEVLDPVDIWFGELWPHRPILSIDFLVRIQSGQLRLSPEHSQAAWVSLEELKQGSPIPLNHEKGFTPEDFEKAEKLISLHGLSL